MCLAQSCGDGRHCIHKCEWEEGELGQKPKTKHKGSVLGGVCSDAAEMGCCMDTATHHAVT